MYVTPDHTYISAHLLFNTLCLPQVDTVCYNRLVPRTSRLVQSLAPRQGSLTGLDPLVTCCVSIYALANCSLTYGDDLPLTGPQATFCQQTSDIVPLAVRNLNSTSLSPTSALVHWDTPLNYLYAGYLSSVRYVITMTTQGTPTSMATTVEPQLLLTSLNMGTSYNVSVTASSPAGSGPPTVITLTTTGLIAPLPPVDPALQLVWSNNLTAVVSWSDPTSLLYSVTSYVVHCRCNDIIYNETMTTNFTVVFPVKQAPYVWCSASVQGVNSVGRSQLSTPVESYYPQAPPPTPDCSESTNLGSEVDFEFDITDPLTLTNKSVSAMLSVGGYGGYVGGVVDNRARFTMLPRNLTYQFRVSLCNRVGCGQPCVLDGTTLMVRLFLLLFKVCIHS